MMKASSLLAPIARRLEGKVAVITGGASGIGASTARLFAKHGAKVIIADIQDDLGHTLCNDIGMDESISYVHCDVSSETDVQNVVDTAVAKHGKLDIMYNNAGISGNMDTTILSVDRQDFNRVFDVNVFGAFFGAKHAARVMIPAKKGSILFTSSLCTVSVAEVPHAYTAAKHAVVGLTKNLCVELGKYGIRVNCISPYIVATPLMRNVPMLMEDMKRTEKVISMGANLKGATMEAEDVAEAALYLGSDESKYVSGVNMVVDGGYSITNTALGEAFKKLFS